MTSPLAVPCPHCRALNRVPAERIGQHPSCGRCHQPLFGGHPVALDAATFDAVAGRGDLPVLVDFWATWCGPCIGFAPVFAAAAKELEPRMRLVKVETEANPALAQRFAIRSIPTLVLLREGREIARQSGALSAAQLRQFVAPVLR
ncbi:thioredoxin TrxC [Dyella sp.]|jgi:thioredoxin 2|uniref:thioredoxin TrxC n=1 Tax=Dyella sp. TaxID=1869338 RepID=UPI002D7922FE|nr:thioredoxin TrxC [Dyella sp.]HET6432739.1 thioredoxin TrxC [Dyella sp.]